MSVKLLIVSCKAYNMQLTIFTLKFGFEVIYVLVTVYIPTMHYN